MTINVTLKLNQTFDMNCPAKHAFEQLADVNNTATLLPKLDKAIELGDGKWRWEMEHIGSGGLSHQVKYTVKYTNNGSTCIQWNPVQGEGNNAQVSGEWAIQAKPGNTCSITFSADHDFELPFPRLMKGLAEGIVKTELEGQLRTFIERIKDKLVTA